VSEDRLRVVLDLDPKDLWLFADAAEEAGQSVADWLVAVARQRTVAHRTPKELNDAIRELHAEGYPDRRIGQMLGVSNATVARRRAVLGLSVVTTQGRRNYP
jgi:DNA-directed RNA polymerase specialized sigma24 family protein